jgi:branched-chain amino acid transport system substrate-binding protein
MFKKIFIVFSFSILVFGCTKKTDKAQTIDSSTQVSDSKDILVGEFGSMTGSEATFGISTHRGIELAVNETNDAGGIKGKQIRLISLDDQGKAEEAASVVTRLITQSKVVAILGEVASSRSLAAAPIAQKNKIPMISPSSTNPKVTEIGDYIFRVCFIDPFQGFVMAKFASENLKLKSVAILKDVKSDYSVGLSSYFKKTFEENGGKIVSEESYVSGDIDFKAQLTQVRAKKPDAIFIPGYYTEVGLIARQVEQLGIKAVLLGGDGWDSPKLYEIGKSAIEGNYYSNHYTTETTDPTVLDFISRYKVKYNEEPSGLAAMGYDAAKVLFAAMTAASDLSPKAIQEAIAATTNFPGVTGNITINKERNAIKPAVVVQVKGATSKFVTSISP